MLDERHNWNAPIYLNNAQGESIMQFETTIFENQRLWKDFVQTKSSDCTGNLPCWTKEYTIFMCSTMEIIIKQANILTQAKIQ